MKPDPAKAADGPVRIIVHAGFHKTGTSTVQATLWANRAVLWPVMALGLRRNLGPVLSAARGYSTWRDPFSLITFAERFADWLEPLNLSGKRALCISAEELAGHMAGRDRVPDYGATPALMGQIASVARERFRRKLRLTFLFTTRDTESWLRSAWAEHVKASRMVLDFDTFAARTRPFADLDAVADGIRAAVGPHTVVTARLEDAGTLALGPAQPLIDLLPLAPARRARIVAATARNVSPAAATLAALLDLNRSDLAPEALKAAKKAVLAQVAEPADV